MRGSRNCPRTNPLSTSIIHPGQNTWATAVARQLAFLIDGADYFRELVAALPQAEKEIWIVGWDFDPDIRLTPGEADEHRLGDFLLAQLEAKPELQVRILVWAMGPVYSGKSLKLFRRNGPLAHERVHIEFDSHHPFGGSHHQKMVVIDDALAFIGGIDLTARRWDDSRHLASNPLRVSPDGKPYEPVHDLQVMVDGPAARRIGDIVRRRWSRATGEDVSSIVSSAALWPSGRPADLRDCRVGLSLTEPGAGTDSAEMQSGRLARDAIRRSRKHIYIEAQYLASFGVAEALEERLKDEDGPEIVIVVTRMSHGFIEKIVMGSNRDRIIRRLKRVDTRDRLWVMFAVVPGEEGREQEVLVHSKLLIVDDVFVRIGSSNLNNRSEGLDTEADLSLEAVSEEESKAIAALRHRLLAEHMESWPEQIAETFAACGSLMRTIEAHNTNRRGLRHFDVDISKGATDPVAMTVLADPPGPPRLLTALRTRAQQFGSRLLGMLF